MRVTARLSYATRLFEREDLVEVDRLERKRGEPFPRIGGPVKCGRPIVR